MKNDDFRRWMHLTGWRLRYLWLDTPIGRWINLGAAALLLILAVFVLSDAHSAAKVGEPVGAAIWVQLVIMVVSSLILLALTPKTPDATDQANEAPRVEDGAGVRMVFGEVWVTDPAVIGWKKMGTKTIRGKKSGFNGRPIIGFWYKQLFHFVLCRGPVDAVLEFRGGDKTAWKGELTASGEVQINRRELWGGQGTGGEGGIEGPLEFLFGDADQQPSSYLAGALGTQQPAYRALLTALFKGGLWGAFSPYPKAASFKVRRILEGWERGEGPWLPDSAVIWLDVASEFIVWTEMFSDGLNSYSVLEGSKAPFTTASDQVSIAASTRSRITRDIPAVTSSSQFRSIEFEFFLVNAASGNSGVVQIYSAAGAYVHGFNPRWGNSTLPLIGYNSNEGPTASIGSSPLADGRWYRYTATYDSVAMLLNCAIHDVASGALWGEVSVSGPSLPISSLRLWSGPDAVRIRGIKINHVDSRLQAMNPAHVIYQSITDSWMGGEPEAGINDVGFRAAAAKLHAEGFGICTEWDSTSESVEAFQQRICDVIGANLSRSPIDGLWNLDLIRAGYDTDVLETLTDDDILDYSEQPGTMQDAVNQVIVEWRDPQMREDRSTAPVQSLGGVQAVGAVVGEVSTYRELPTEALALRVAARNLQSKARPLRRISCKVTRIGFGWRPGQVIRLQSSKRGIASMYCRIGDADRGTLRSGAISLTLLQDVFGLPQSVYVSPEPGTGADEDLPRPVAASLAMEVPYALLAALQPPGELAAMPVDSGYLFAVGTPEAGEIDYSLQADAGAGYVEQAESDWAATAVNTAGVDRFATVIPFTASRRLDEAVLGSMVLWGPEICRLDAIDVIGGTVTLGRGCADTLAVFHDPGDRLWVVDDSIALDATRYSDGTVVSLKLLPRTSSQRLDLSAAASSIVEFDSRAARPYPPVGLTLNGEMAPVEIFETADVEWRHRDRLASADQLVDQTAASVGPEAGTTYTVRWFIDGALEHVETGVVGTTTSYTPTTDGELRVEVEAVREGIASWQMQVVTCGYRVSSYSDYVDQSDGVYVDQNGQIYNG